MFSILLKQTIKLQVPYSTAISHNLIMVVFFFIELNNLNLICFENHKKPEADFPNWLKKLLQMVGSWKVIAKLLILQQILL